ncbi:MAG: VCBS repeat-containing protein [Bacteroidales bacterium]
MKTFKNISLYLFLIVPLLLVSFTTGDNKSQYNIPLSAYSVTAGDLDKDGDIDIVVGHNYNPQTQWSGISLLINNGDGTFFLNDSVFLYSWQTHTYAVNTDTDSLPEIIVTNTENETQYTAILNIEQGSYTTNLYYMNYGISGNNIGDINGDSFIDIVLYSNDNQFWGVMFNDGTGNFSAPQYHNIEDYFPSDIACADLNDDGRDVTAIFASKMSIFQL